MSNLSLQEQLLKAGLSNDAKAKQIKTEKRKQVKKQRKNKIEVKDETKQLVQENKTRQQEKDKSLNQQRNEKAEKKQIANQILHLIDINKLVQDKEGDTYQFTDQNKVKVIYISKEMRKKIIAGRLAIVKSKQSYEVVVSEVAEKIKQRDEKLVIVLFTESIDRLIDDEYQGYEIPDDLMW